MHPHELAMIAEQTRREVTRYAKTGWITIGATEGEDGETHGGTPVRVSGGKITAGPPSLKGETMDDLKDKSRHPVRAAKGAHASAESKTGKDYTPSQARSLGGENRVAMHQAAKSAAKGTGVPVHHVLQTMHKAHEHISGQNEAREAAKAELRKNLGMTAGDAAKHENAYKDHSTVKGFDTAARDIAERYPDLGFDPDSTDTPAKVWELLREGKGKHVALHSQEVADLAAEWLRGRLGRDADPSPTHHEIHHAMSEVRQWSNGKWNVEGFPTSHDTKWEAVNQSIQRQRHRNSDAAGVAGDYPMPNGNFRAVASEHEIRKMFPEAEHEHVLRDPTKLSSIIDKVNKKNEPEGGWTDADKVPEHLQSGKPQKSLKPQKLTQSEFIHQYNEAFERLMDYSPNEVGSQVYAEKLAKLEEDYPEFAKQMDEEAEKVGATGKPIEPEKRPGVPGMQSSLFDEEASGQKQLFNYVPPKKGENKPKPVESSLLEKIGDELKEKQ